MGIRRPGEARLWRSDPTLVARLDNWLIVHLAARAVGTVRRRGEQGFYRNWRRAW